jgi:DNA-binding transcriptional regulator YhcF (GntR family)
VAELGDWVRVDQHAAKPLFDQLRTQIIDGIRDGKLSPGTRLPTVRELAGQMSLAVNTVARAYRELESAGVLETRGRFGTFVARVDPADTAMATAAHTFVSAARALGSRRTTRCDTSRRRSRLRTSRGCRASAERPARQPR